MDNLSTVVWALFRGLTDSLKGTIVLFSLDKSIKEKALQQSISPRHRNSPARLAASQTKSTKANEPKILWRTVQCCLLNGGVFWASMVLFEMGVLPLLELLVEFCVGDSTSMSRYVWYWTRTALSLTFGALWVVPLFLLSKIVNSLWFLDIAAIAYRHSRGRPQAVMSVSRSIADTIFSVLVQVLFLMQAMLMGWLPAPACTLLSTLHMAMLYSLYCFEYKWVNMGWELHRRLTFIENNWPYFVGFGLPLHFLTCFTSSYIVSGCFFSMAFPLFLVSGNEADPVVGVPSGFPLQLFTPVIAISNAMLRKSVKSAR